jgi:hypothetical protein
MAVPRVNALLAYFFGVSRLSLCNKMDDKTVGYLRKQRNQERSLRIPQEGVGYKPKIPFVPYFDVGETT